MAAAHQGRALGLSDCPGLVAAQQLPSCCVGLVEQTVAISVQRERANL